MSLAGLAVNLAHPVERLHDADSEVPSPVPVGETYMTSPNAAITANIATDAATNLKNVFFIV